MQKSSRIKNLFDSPQYDICSTTLRVIDTKIRITQQKLNKNRKDFNPLVSGPG